MPSSFATTRVAYGSANSRMNSQRPAAAKASISSPASAWNAGTIAAISDCENAGVVSRRSRAWSSPSWFRMLWRHQSAQGPVMPR